jgi:hypothetical protein
LLPGILLIFASFIFWLVSNIFEEPLIACFGISLSFSMFYFFLFLGYSTNKIISMEFDNRTIKTLLLIITFISTFLILYIKPYEGSILNWMEIPMINWLRYISSLLLTSLLIGYYLLKIIDRKNIIQGTASIVLSYLLSMFVTFIYGFFILLSGQNTTSFTIIITVITSITLAIIYYFSELRKNNKFIISLNKYEIGVIISVLSFIMICSLVIMIYNIPLTRSDMWQVYSQALEYSKGFPIYDNSFVPFYPYLYQIYLSIYFKVSGLPSAVALQTLYVFSFIPILAFYSMIKIWFYKDNKKIPIIANYLSILLGYGSLYTIYLNISGSSNWSSIISWSFNFDAINRYSFYKTFDDIMLFPYIPYMVAWRWVIGLPTLFMLIYLLKIDNLIVFYKPIYVASVKYFLFAVLIAIGYLGHIIEIPFFLLILISYEIFFNHKFDWKIGISILLGFLIVLAVDYLAPVQAYLFTYNILTGQKTLNFPYIIVVLLTFVILVIDTLRHNKRFLSYSDIKQKILLFITNNWKYARWGFLYFYLLCIVIWIFSLQDHNVYNINDIGIPLYLFPLRFGFVGLLSIISIFIYLPEILHNDNLSFFLLISIIGFTLEQMSNFQLLNYSDISRYYAIIYIGLCVLASYGIERFIHTSQNRFPVKKTLLIVLIFLLIIPSMLSTTFYYTSVTYYNGRRNMITDSELGAIKYIEDNLSHNETVLTFTIESTFKLHTFAGITAQSIYGSSDRNIVTYGLLNTTNPYIITEILGSLKVRYIYVAQEDVAFLNSKDFYFNYFLNYFYKVFVAPETTVYEIPSLTPPTKGTNFGVLYYPPPRRSLFFDGLDDYISITTNTLLNIKTNQTIELWLYLNNLPSSPHNTALFFKESCYGLCVSYDGRIGYCIWGKIEATSGANVITPGRWHNIVWSYDGKVHRMYVDGTEKLSNVIAETVPILSNDIIINHDSLPGYILFDGLVDDVRIYDRALTAIEVSEHLQGVYKNERELVLHLDFDQDVNDSSGKENHGINHGAQCVLNTHSIPTEEIFPAIFTSFFGSKYSVLYVDDEIVRSLDPYISNYSQIMLTSDPKSPPSDLINWVSKGGNLVVFNTYGTGFCAQLLNITLSLANPLYLKEFGSGKILYVNIYSLLKSNTVQEIFQSNLLKDIKRIIKMPNNDFEWQVQPDSTPNQAYGSITVRGNISISSDLLVIEGNIQLEQALNHSFEQNLNERNLTKITVFGRSTLTIYNETLTIHPSESYLYIEPKNNVVNGNIFIEDSKSVLIINDTIGGSNIIKDRQEIKFQGTKILVLERLPKINATGEIFFKSLCVYVAPYVPLSGIVLEEAKVQGNVEFNTKSISAPLILFSKFILNGEIQGPYTEKHQILLPWTNIITSPEHIACIMLIALGIVLEIRFKKLGKLV